MVLKAFRFHLRNISWIGQNIAHKFSVGNEGILFWFLFQDFYLEILHLDLILWYVTSCRKFQQK